MKRITILFLFVLSIFVLKGFGQEVLLNGTFESWDDTNTPSSWTHVENVDQESAVGNIHGGTYSAKHTGGTSDLGQYISGIIPGDDYTLTIWYKVIESDGTDARIWCYWRSGGSSLNDNADELRGPNGSYLDNSGGIWTEYSVTVTAPATADEFYFEVRTYSGAIVYWDDFSFYHESSGSPSILVSDLSLGGFNYEVGNGPSTEQSFTVEGINLIDDINISPSTNYEISLDNVTYQLTPITLPQSGSTTVYTRLQAGLSVGDYIEDLTVSSTGATDQIINCSGAVESPATTTLPYYQTFDTDLGDCYTYSVLGDNKFWIWDDNNGNDDGHTYMNGFNYSNTEPENDWLILPGMNLDNYNGEIMHFYTSYAYGSQDLDNYLKLLYSTDYPGVGDPSGYTWNELPFAVAGNWDTWITSGFVDLSGISGTSVYIGFQYYSTADPRSWRIDDITVTDESAKVDVTFQVNMAEQTVSGDGVHIAGSFDDWWNPAGYQLLDPDLDEIYSTTLSLYPGVEYQFKYINGNDWPFNETVPIDCQAPETTNRFVFTGTSNFTLDPVCFGSCQDCGTPQWNITFQVDMQNETVTGDVYIAGDFNGWSDQTMTNTSGTIYEATILLEEGTTYQYKFKNGPTGWENFDGPCVPNYGDNRSYTTPTSDATVDLVCFNSCDACPVADFVMINELDADQDGTDAAEFIELYDGGVGNTDLSGLVVVLYNGSTDLSYDAFDLDGQTTDANGYFVMGSAIVPNVDMVIGTTNILQNGADAAALYIGNDFDFPNDTPVLVDGTLIDALVYDTNDGDDPELLALLNAGQPQVNEAGAGSSIDHSNQRIPNGSGGLRNTYTYAQTLPTPGAENGYLATIWTGVANTDWNNSGNWDNGVPVLAQNATVPVVATNYPVIGVGAACNDLTVDAGASLEIASNGNLTVNGLFTNNGDLTIKSDASGTGSLITFSSISGTIERYFTGNDLDWHLVSSPVASAQAGVFMDMYLQSFDNATYTYTDIEDETTPLNVMEGYALYSTLGADNTVSFTGTLNTGLQQKPVYTGADSYNWNLVGNPYPCSIDWNSVTIPANMSNEVHFIDAATGADLSYVKSVGGTGSQYIAPMQGFFVSVTGDDVFELNTGAKTHLGTDNFYKSDNPNLLVLEASGANFSDETWIHFNENAGVEHDGQFDAYKRISLSNPELPQIFSITPQGTKLSINGMPQTEAVPVGFTAVNAGTFTISAKETGEFSKIILEDLLVDEQVDLLENDYTFNYEPNTMENRFVIHFSPVGINETDQNNIQIYSFNNNVYINAQGLTTGSVRIYNLMGQEVVNANLTADSNRITLDKSGYYVVSVISDKGISSEKVFIQ